MSDGVIIVNGSRLTLPTALIPRCAITELRAFIASQLPDTEGDILAHATPNGIEVIHATGTAYPVGEYVTIPASAVAAIRYYPGA